MSDAIHVVAGILAATGGLAVANLAGFSRTVPDRGARRSGIINFARALAIQRREALEHA